MYLFYYLLLEMSVVIVLCFYRGGPGPPLFYSFWKFQGKNSGVGGSDGRSQGRGRDVGYSSTERGWLYLHGQA